MAICRIRNEHQGTHGGTNAMGDYTNTHLVNIFNAEIVVMRLLLIATLLVVLAALAM